MEYPPNHALVSAENRALPTFWLISETVDKRESVSSIGFSLTLTTTSEREELLATQNKNKRRQGDASIHG